MNVTIRPCRLSGEVTAPPSKSYAHRMMICAALANGKSELLGIEESQDILATLDCLTSLGASATPQKNAFCICGADPKAPHSSLFPCRESGSTLRFFLPLALLSGQSVTFSGSDRLIERGIGVYEEVLAQKGISFSKATGSITACGRLSAGNYALRGDVSSQFISGLLFALPLCDGDSILQVLPPFESRGYVDLTLDAMAQFGVQIEKDGNTFLIKGNQSYRAQKVQVEGDWSQAAFLFALRTFGNEVTVTGLNPQSLQGDRICIDYLAQLALGAPTLDLSDCPDLAPILFVAASALHGAHFIGTARLKRKESDRANVMAQELAKFGADLCVRENDVLVSPRPLHAPSELLCGHNDHRIVMALCVLATRLGGTITDAQAISKSYPDFFTDLQALGAEVESWI